MKKARSIAFLLFMLICFKAYSQVLPANFNLVPNPGFELGGVSGRLDTSFTTNPHCWTAANHDWARIHRNLTNNNLTGFLEKRGGAGYVPSQNVWFDTISEFNPGFNYFQSRLLEPLVAGDTYHFSVKVACNKSSQWSSLSIFGSVEVHFSDTQLYYDTGKIYLTPHIQFKTWTIPMYDTLLFVELKATYIANGGEQYLTIGRFSPFTELEYVHISPADLSRDSLDLTMPVYIDDVVLVRDTNIASLTHQPLNLGNDTVLCVGDSVQLGGDPYYSSYNWNTGETSPFITVHDTGTYWCTVSFACYMSTDTIRVLSPASLAPFSIQDTGICPGRQFTVHAPAGYYYLWQDNSTDDSLVVSSPGNYWLRISDGCAAFTDSFIVQDRDTPLVAFTIPDTAVCTGQNLTIHIPANQFAYLWTGGSIGDSLNINTPGIYWVQISNYCGSSLSDTFAVNDKDVPIPPFNIPDTSVCAGASLTIYVPVAGFDYTWNDLSTGDTLAVSSFGVYWLRVANACGTTVTDTFRVSDRRIITPFAIADSAICPGQSYTVYAPPAPQYLWSDLSTDDTLSVALEGLYWIEISDDCGSSRDSFMVSSRDTPLVAFALPDTGLCTGQTITVRGPGHQYAYRWTGGNTADSLDITAAGSYWLEITSFCGSALADTFLVADKDIALPVFNIPDTAICSWAAFTITAPPGAYDYTWSNGSTDDTLHISAAGKYWLRVSNQCGSSVTDTFQVTDRQIIAPFQLPDSALCPGQSYTVRAPAAITYLWSNLTTADTLEVIAPGTFWLEISDDCTFFRDTFFVISLDTPLVSFSFPDTAMCIGKPFTARGPAGQFAYRWNNGSTADSLVISTPGTYWLETSNYCGRTLTDTFVVQNADIPSFPFMIPDSALCPGESYVVQQAPKGRYAYLWSNGSTADTLLITAPGKHWLRISNICGSGITDTFSVRDKHTPIPPFNIADTTICPGTSITVNVPGTLPPGTIAYNWSTGDATSFTVISTPDDYWVTLTDECAIGFSDTFHVSIADTTLPAFAFPDTILCIGKPLTVAGPAGDFDYLWSNVQTTRGTTIQAQGMYSLTITHRCSNSRSASFEVTAVSDPVWTDLPASLTICTGDTAVLEPAPGFVSYLWSNGSTAPVLRITAAGAYTVIATGLCDQYTSTTEVLVQDPPRPFSLGSDTTICAGEVLTLAAPPGFAYLWNTGSSGPDIAVQEPGSYACTVSNDCGSVSASVTVSVVNPPQPPLVITGETDLCRSGSMQPVTLATATEGVSLLWNTGAVTSQITVNEPGVYSLRAFNDCGAISDSVYVRGCAGILGFPTAFSPNGDGRNDVFRPIVQDAGQISEYQLQIFNRWGNMVFESTNPAAGWGGHIKGAPAASGVYFWQCRVKAGGEERMEKGDVSLVR